MTHFEKALVDDDLAGCLLATLEDDDARAISPRGMSRTELEDLAYEYVKHMRDVADVDVSETTAQALIDVAVDSTRDREDVAQLRQEDGDVEIVVASLRCALRDRAEREEEELE